MSNVKLEGSSSTQQNSSAGGTAKLRTNLALHHLFAACRFTADIIKIEKENENRPFGEHWEEVLHNALAVLTLSTAALEAYANELYFEGAPLSPQFNAATVGILSKLVDRGTIIEKYDLFLTLCKSEKLDRGVSIVQNVQVLIELRNAVIHFRPEWDDTKGNHSKLSARLAYRFKPSSYFPGEALFPRAWASGEFAAWALNTIIAFLDYFFSKTGVANPCDPFRHRFSTYSNGVVKAP